MWGFWGTWGMWGLGLLGLLRLMGLQQRRHPKGVDYGRTGCYLKAVWHVQR